MNNYDIKKRNLLSIGPHTPGLLFIAVGLFTFVSPFLFSSNNSLLKIYSMGSFFLLIGLVIVTSYGGTIFDFKKKQYKNYYSLSGIKIGQWQALPVIKQIRMYHSITKGTKTFDGIHPSASGNVSTYKLILYTDKLMPVMSFENYSKTKLLKDAETLSENFSAKLDVQLSDVI